MTCRENCTIDEKIYEYILEKGLEGLVPAIELLLNEAMKFERNKYLGGMPYERFRERKDYANGYKDKKLKLRLGEVQLKIPQVRGGEFYPSMLEKGVRSERALKVAIAEMYIQGVSTRKMTKIMEKLCGTEVSSSEVSRVSKLLDEELEKWRNRKLGNYRYIYFDARYEKVRMNQEVRDVGILLGIGISEAGKKEVLGVSIELSEAEVHWRKFMESLVNRGIHGIELIISDAHTGLGVARKAVFPGGALAQRCQFHLQQDAQSYAPKRSMRKEVASTIRSIFDAPNKMEADRLLNLSIKQYETRAPHLATWMEKSIPEGLTVFSFPKKHRQRIRTSNMIERLNREINRRTQVVGIFPNEASALRLITAVLMETSEDWSLENQCYLNFDPDDLSGD